MSDEDDNMKMEYYLEIGAIVLEGVDENGEFIFSISENAKDLAPELWEAHQQYTEDAIMELYKKDLLTIEYDENLEASISISPAGIALARQYGLIDPQEINDIPND